MVELYDLAADPNERENLMGTEREQALLPALQSELARLQRDTREPPP